MKIQGAGGIRLATVDTGAGLPVLLVHGFPLDHTMWDAQIDALSEACRVIAPDLRGFGRSEVTEGKVTMEEFADDLAALLASLGIEEPVVLCGLSMGGYVGWQFWRKYTRQVRALIVCDSRAAADTHQAAADRLRMAERVLSEGPALLVEAMTPKLFAKKTSELRPEVIDSVRRVMLSGNPRGIAAAAQGMAERPDFTPMLPHVDCPTLVLVGQQDILSTVDEMRSIAEAIPGAELVVIPGAGHMAPMEKPKEVNAALLTFLARLKA